MIFITKLKNQTGIINNFHVYRLLTVIELALEKMEEYKEVERVEYKE